MHVYAFLYPITHVSQQNSSVVASKIGEGKCLLSVEGIRKKSSLKSKRKQGTSPPFFLPVDCELERR